MVEMMNPKEALSAAMSFFATSLTLLVILQSLGEIKVLWAGIEIRSNSTKYFHAE
jgi:hypothetical protein